jgi:hypothetical protein
LEAEVEALSQQLARLLAGPTEEKLLTSKEIAPFVGVMHHKAVEKWVRDKNEENALRAAGAESALPAWRRPCVASSA